VALAAVAGVPRERIVNFEKLDNLDLAVPG